MRTIYAQGMSVEWSIDCAVQHSITTGETVKIVAPDVEVFTRHLMLECEWHDCHTFRGPDLDGRAQWSVTLEALA